MARFLTNLFLLVLGVALVAFFFANRSPVVISFDPTSLNNPAIALPPMPLWVGLSGSLMVGVVLGAIGMWISHTRLRQRADARKRQVAELKREVKLANQRPVETAPVGAQLAAPEA